MQENTKTIRTLLDTTLKNILAKNLITFHKERYSIAFFADPDSSTKVSVFPSCFNSENPSKFSDITPGEHIAQKIEESNNLKI